MPSLPTIFMIEATLAVFLILCAFSAEPPQKIRGLEVESSTYKSATLSWHESDNAKVYHIYRSEDGKTYELLETTTENTYKDTNLETGKKYYYIVTASNGIRRQDPETQKTIEAVPSLKKPKIQVAAGDGEVDVSIKKVSGATGYEIYRDGQLIAKQKDTEYADKDIGTDSEYTYSVRAVRETEEGPVYSRMSKPVGVELIFAGDIDLEIAGDLMLVKWDGNDQLSTYQLYNGEELLTETTGHEYLIEGIQSGDEYDLRLTGTAGEIKSQETVRKFTVVGVGMSNADAIEEACRWGVMIAEDDDFTYGTGKRSHRHGCYFCGTNVGPRKVMKGKSLVNGHSYEKTYCCNPFVSACYAHGAGDAKLQAACRTGHGVGMKVSSYTKYGHWTKAGKPSYSSLRRGDVLVKRTHVVLYLGDGLCVQAGREGWDAESISVSPLSSKKYGTYSFVMRYTGNGRGVKLVAEDEEEN